MITWQSGRMGAPKAPIARRHSTSSSSVPACAAITERLMKPAIEIRKRRLPPIRDASHPVVTIIADEPRTNAVAT